MIKIEIYPYLLHFKQPAGTSRGVYTTRKVWYIHAKDRSSDKEGWGECAPLPSLSCDESPEYEKILREFCDKVELTGKIDYESMIDYPSMLFGLETALRHMERDKLALWDSPFSRGEKGIAINGLVWMGNFEEMYKRIEEKLHQGYKCIKLKIGAIDFEKELELIAHIREHFSPEDIELRVDANGAFEIEDALKKLNALAKYELHSIEQPIRQGQWQTMARLCRDTPLPIALDEELIGVNHIEDKIKLLDTIKPQYIILKPSLHGGIYGSSQWISLAKKRGIGWWVTSALESNIGLNAIASWCGSLNPNLPQGLGTGKLFWDNINYPLEIKGDYLRYNSENENLVDFRLDFRKSLSDFLEEWNNDEPLVSVHTSGSTGAPKKLMVEKKRMIASAQATISFLGLRKGEKALLCMPLDFIGGKMVVIRALVAGLDLISVYPSGHPLDSLTQIPDFAAMTPMQVYNSICIKGEREKLKKIKNLIIGGGAIDSKLEAELADFPNALWSTYGMTETLSHIALRRINGPDASQWYSPLGGVSVRLSETGTLIINAPEICDGELQTNDLACFNDKGQFKIIGRVDNIINTGGIKVQIEEVEKELKKWIELGFAISSKTDEKFGEIVVLVVEAKEGEEIKSKINKAVSHLPKYWQPKKLYFVTHLPKTPTGKFDRAKIKELSR